MSAYDRVRWDGYYRHLLKKPFPAVDPLLLDYTPPVPISETRRALDLACGFGQNGLWLAEQGYTADLMDISRIALGRARAEMTIRNLRNVNLFQIDLDDLKIEEEKYQMVCVFFYLKQSIMTKLLASVAPGGRLIYKTYNIAYLDIVPQFNTDFLLGPGELGSIFEGWQIIHHEEESHISQIVTVKPEKG